MADKALVDKFAELGFDRVMIEDVLLATNNNEQEALNFLFGGQASSPTSNDNALINQLKTELQKVKISNVSEDTMREALSKNNDNVKQAVAYIIKQQQQQQQQQPTTKRQSQSQSQYPNSSTQTQTQAQRSSIKRTSSIATGNAPSQLHGSNKDKDKLIVNSREDVERMKQRLLQDCELNQKEKEKEKQRKEIELRKQEDDSLIEEKKKEVQRIEMQKKVAENRALILAKKKQAESERRIKLLEWHKRHEKYDAADKAVYNAMMQNRIKAEQALKTPEQAIQCMFERYGEELARESLQMIEKILQRIVENPKEAKYRRFNLDNRKIHTKIETPLGAMRLLELVGFAMVQDSGETLTDEKPLRYMVLKEPVNVKSLDQALQTISKYLTVKETLAASVLRKLEERVIITTMASSSLPSSNKNKDKSKELDAEQLYCAVVTLHNLIRNLFISPMSEHLRYINLNDAVFQERVGKVHELIDMLLQLGYVKKESPRGTYLCFEFDEKCGMPLTSSIHPQVRLLQAVAMDLSNSSKRILPHTPIAQALSTLRNNHSGDPSKQVNLEKVFALLEKALDKIIEQPLDMTIQSISLDKIKAKYPDVTGITSLLQLLGFVRSNKNILSKNDQYKQVTKVEAIFQLNTNDFDLLRIRKDILALLIHNKSA